MFSALKFDLKFILMSSNIHTAVLLNLLNSLQKRDKMLCKPHILSLFPNSFNKFNKTRVLMSDPLYIYLSCKPIFIDLILLSYGSHDELKFCPSPITLNDDGQ